MNPLVILFWVVLSIVLLALIGAPFILGMVTIEREEWSTPRAWVASCVVSVLAITFGTWLLVTIFAGSGEDEAAHCGPGTHYVSQDRLVGKTIEHDWMCTS